MSFQPKREASLRLVSDTAYTKSDSLCYYFIEGTYD